MSGPRGRDFHATPRCFGRNRVLMQVQVFLHRAEGAVRRRRSQRGVMPRRSEVGAAVAVIEK